MRFLLPSILLVLATFGIATAEDAVPHADPKPNLTILADENLMLPAAQFARAYAKTNGTPLTVVLKNAANAESQILQGLEAHLLLTSNHTMIGHLADQGLTDVSSTKPIARTQLALVAAHDLSKEGVLAKRISFAALLNATPNMPVYVNDPATPEGSRAATLMKGFEFSDTLATRAVVKSSREEVLDSVREGNGLGLMLAADAVSEPDITVISLLPESISTPVTYEVVVLASESMGDARQLATFLQSPKAQEIFAHFGFQPAE